MPVRTRLIAGNWKMNRTAMETEQFLGQFDAEMGKAELLICMPFTDLYLAEKYLAGTGIKWGAQNVYPAEKIVLAYGMTPILCVGETLEERESGQMKTRLLEEMRAALSGLSPEELLRTVIAYEPVWAIGTGKAATAQDAETVSAFIRKTIEAFSSGGVAEQIRILYGGSVTGENISSFLREKDVDGALIGGASLKAEELLSIYKKACE